MDDVPWTPDRIAQVRFRPVRGRHGYDMGDVDAFLDRVQAAVRDGEPVAPLVEQAAFSTTSLREGYDMGEVDAFLDQVAGIGPGREPATPPPAAPPMTPPMAPPMAPPAAPPVTQAMPVAGEPQPVAVQEQRGLLARLFGRRG